MKNRTNKLVFLCGLDISFVFTEILGQGHQDVSRTLDNFQMNLKRLDISMTTTQMRSYRTTF